uniref:Uncharacterized protein n=1 Tax=Plectus sambesii TaxID=2011161 RepID=A0A914W676_9BILA
MWGTLAKAAAVVLVAGSCYSMTAMTVKEFLSKPTLNATAHTLKTQIFANELIQMETAATTIEAEIMSYNPTLAVVWPRCPTPTCYNKNLTEQSDGSFICGSSQRQLGCAGVYWSDDVLVGATIAVMALINGRPESFDQYKIYTKSVARLTLLPTTFAKSFDLSKAFDKDDFPVYAKVRLLTNTAKKALEVEEVVEKSDDEDEEF